jgi:hypothetical protein
VIGCVPLQLPFAAVSVWPSWAVPLIVGGDVFAGGTGGADFTTAVCAEVAVTVPLLFVALTATRSVEPTSELVTMYVLAVAPVMELHALPLVLQRRHWYA